VCTDDQYNVDTGCEFILPGWKLVWLLCGPYGITGTLQKCSSLRCVGCRGRCPEYPRRQDASENSFQRGISPNVRANIHSKIPKALRGGRGPNCPPSGWGSLYTRPHPHDQARHSLSNCLKQKSTKIAHARHSFIACALCVIAHLAEIWGGRGKASRRTASLSLFG
jgi:hypothetical protein